MSELATLSAEILADLQADAPEVLQSGWFDTATSSYLVTCIADKLSLTEQDSESVKVASGVWAIFGHMLPVAPQPDDTLRIGARTHYVIARLDSDPVAPVPVMWRVATRG